MCDKLSAISVYKVIVTVSGRYFTLCVCLPLLVQSTGSQEENIHHLVSGKPCYRDYKNLLTSQPGVKDSGLLQILTLFLLSTPT